MTANTAIGIERLGRVQVKVVNFEEAVTFYRDILGLELVFAEGGWAEFRLGSTTLSLNHQRKSSDVLADTPELYLKVTDFDTAYKLLQDRGASPGKSYSPFQGAGRFAIFKDPSGNVLVLQEND